MAGAAGPTRTTGTIRTTRTRLARAGRDPRGAAFWRGPARSRPPSKRMGTILHICAVRQERNVTDSRRPALLRAPSCGWVDPSCGWVDPSCGWVPHGNDPPRGRLSRTPARATVWTALALLALVPVTIPSAHATPAAPSGAGARVETGGTTLWYEVRGTAAGRPLVMVNGGPGFDHTYVLCSDAWDRIARGRRVVFYDQRGTGRSAPLKPGQSCTLANQVDDLEALRARLGAAKIDLLGHSWGGYLVMAYAALHPDRISHLILCDSAAPKWKDPGFLFKYIFPEQVSQQESFAFAEALGDANAQTQDLSIYMSMLFYSKENKEAFLAKA